MAYDYSTLFVSEDGISDTWREIYSDNLTLPGNLLNILKQTIFLPHDFYDIIATYFMLPSALCKIVPYLFLNGQSGSGKSTLAKLASCLHGVPINSSSDTFAGIRNSLEERRTAWAEVPVAEGENQSPYKTVERNTCMVWDDVSANTFTSSPELYNMFKFGYDKSTDKIVVSSKETGVNIEFRCFCPKVFSSISPLHLDDRFKELRRRLIVIPCSRVEELSDNRKIELGITDDNWQSALLDISAYSWKGFSKLYDEFWDIDVASTFVTARRILSKSVKGLGSQQRTISLDMMACGIATGIWSDDTEAVNRMRDYWFWFKRETEKSAGLSSLLRDFVATETKNALNANMELILYTAQIRGQVDMWVQQGWLFEAPKPRDTKECLLDLGLRLQKGKWTKG